MADEFDPRLEADALIARALQIVVDANPDDLPRGRDYTLEELDTLFFSLGMAMVQLAKLPNGQEAKAQHIENIKAELKRRRASASESDKLGE